MDPFSFKESASPRRPNSHLSLLAMVDSWYHLGIHPYTHLICQTPLFRLWLGTVEHLFLNDVFLKETLSVAVFLKENRPDDMEFCSQAQGWVECIEFGNQEMYKKRFEETCTFFKDRSSEAQAMSSQLIERMNRQHF